MVDVPPASRDRQADVLHERRKLGDILRSELACLNGLLLLELSDKLLEERTSLILVLRGLPDRGPGEEALGGPESRVRVNLRVIRKQLAVLGTETQKSSLLLLLVPCLGIGDVLAKNNEGLSRWDNAGREIRGLSAQTHLGEDSLLFRERMQTLVQRVCDNSAHRLIPRGVHVYVVLLEKVREGLLGFLERPPSALGNDVSVDRAGRGGGDHRRRSESWRRSSRSGRRARTRDMNGRAAGDDERVLG